MSKWVKLVGFIYYIVLIYSCFLFPFTFKERFFNHSFVYAFTFGSTVLMVTSFLGNSFISYIVVFGFNFTRPLDFLLVGIATADLLLPLLHYPIRLVLAWDIQKRRVINFESMSVVWRYLNCASQGCLTLSFSTLAAVFLSRLYILIKRQNLIPKWFKYVTMLIILILAIIVSYVMYFHNLKLWSHAFESCVILFLPLLVIAVCVTIASRINPMSVPFNEGQRTFYNVLVFTYVLYWTPWFVIQLLHRYCCEINYQRLTRIEFFSRNLIHLKCCTNIFLILLFDKRFLYTGQNILARYLPAVLCRKQETVQFELEDFSLRYSVTESRGHLGVGDGRLGDVGGSVVDDAVNDEELYDKQALITTMQEIHLDFTKDEDDNETA